MVLCIGYFTVQPCDYWVTGLRLKDIFYPLLSAELWKVIQVESYGYTTIFLADSANLGTSFLVNMLVWVCLTTNLLCSSEYLPAATKLGQGNIFRSVCQEFCPRGVLSASITPKSRHPPRADTHPPAYGQRAAGTHPTGMHSCCLCNLFRQFFLKIPGINSDMWGNFERTQMWKLKIKSTCIFNIYCPWNPRDNSREHVAGAVTLTSYYTKSS